MASAPRWVCLFAFTAALHAQGIRTYEGKETRVKANTTPEVAKLAVARIDRYCAELERFYGAVGLEKRNNNMVIARVFATHDEFVAFRNRDVGDLPWAAYFSRSANAIVIYDDAEDSSLKHTLFHEVQHQFLARFTFYAPKWLNEGLSEYFEGWRIPDQGPLAKALNLYDLIVLRTALSKKKFVPLAEQIALSPADFVDFAKKYPDVHGGLHYATGWGLVHYFLELAPQDTAAQDDATRFKDYLRALNGKGARGAQAKLAIDWGEFEPRWRQAILEVEPKCETADDFLEVASGYRGDAQWEDAVAAYAAALRKDNTRVGVRFWLGLGQKRMGEYEAAVKTLEAARAEAPTDPRPSYQLARIAARVDRDQEPGDYPKALALAREASDRAGKKNPFYLAFVAECQALGGDQRGAQATMTKAIALCDKEERADYEEHKKRLAELGKGKQ
jgi:hypothetical protein